MHGQHIVHATRLSHFPSLLNQYVRLVAPRGLHLDFPVTTNRR